MDRNKAKRKKWLAALKIIILVYCIIGILLFYLQDHLLFHPEPLDKGHSYAFSQPFRELNIPYSAGSNINVIQFVSDSIPKGVVLYFHGNRDNIARYAPLSSQFTKNGYEIWMIDYPGFGKSTGPFTEAALYDWALTFYKLARARYSPDSIIIYGKSLGTGMATQLASVRDCKHLILETPFYSLPSVVGFWLPLHPVNHLIHYKFPNGQYLQKVTAPVTIFTGTDDLTIPLRNSQRLQPSLKTGDEFIVVEGGSHNDLFKFKTYTQKIDLLLN